MNKDLFNQAYIETVRVFGPDDSIAILMEELHFCTEDEWRNISTSIQSPLIKLAEEMIETCQRLGDRVFYETD
jgi:hypothetical protein